ncbi:polysaccharide deacetylase family protein [Natronobacterium gregoryi]|uniref:Polysaccharide deacetylase n=2 Tax=Natronobacterium gregoryi TaxID=44930 RepID=L0AKZ9_NATGS|nr:polysaccharide deacetylase family protein [Natronobacterium gregoryi]AFZ74104.1 Polysaccharide deacetylase [Natronobacterium gregoryi SP2]ELY63840.1 polysaccharide deacetylase [Natronobacterium gregoryi SP2]PLK18719.1 polysaccharide deacetylase [Natronobacterium gregoryi SP2]SFJ67022.1 Polysaccharide deacetylase [Natronobacterium gregoryi]
MDSVGSVVLSLDAELGWGFHDLERLPSDRVESGRSGWTTMLELCAEYDVPATWAVVGHLMLDACDGVHEGHPTPEGWFARERDEWADREEFRFAPDLVGGVLEADVDHELASHSFSHVLFGRPETDSELATAEIRRSLEIADEWGQSIDSFVYPRNDIGHREILAENGITAYRGRSPTYDGVRGFVDSTVRSRSMLVEPEIDEHGLVDVPASLFLFGFEGPARTVAESIWEDPMVVQAQRGIDQAARSDGLFHMWLHPNNLTHERDDRRMRAILAYLDRRRAETDLTVETIGGVAHRFDAVSRIEDEAIVVDGDD